MSPTKLCTHIYLIFQVILFVQKLLNWSLENTKSGLGSFTFQFLAINVIVQYRRSKKGPQLTREQISALYWPNYQDARFLLDCKFVDTVTYYGKMLPQLYCKVIFQMSKFNFLTKARKQVNKLFQKQKKFKHIC